MDKICKNCKHWGGYEDYETDKYKICHKWGMFLGESAEKERSIIVEHDGSIMHKDLIISDEIASAVIKEIYLDTNENFGCVKWIKSA